jgi:hypothetical protein
MLDKLVYAVGHYAALILVLLACWGVGQAVLRLRAMGNSLSPGMRVPLATTLGLGLSITVLQYLAIAGLLMSAYVLAWLCFGLAAAAAQLTLGRTTSPKAPPLSTSWNAWPFVEKCAFVLLMLGLVSTVAAPLAVPLQWDELMYHLPHAREWALSGHLQVNEWLRYPWFPYNYNLLYAAALVFNNDILPHLLHASAGWLITWLIYQLGLQYLNRVTACLAGLNWLGLSAAIYDAAYIDMGVALFVLAGATAFQQWRFTQARAWLVVSAFFFGVAAGSKYQVLAILPFFAIALVWFDRRPSSWLVAVLGFAAPCVYWYARNALATGDPFSPLGGKLFGFSDWNLSDYEAQFADLRDRTGPPHWTLWPALLCPWLPALRKHPAARGAMWLSAWMLLTWAVTSRYPRYLMTAYPVLVLLAAAGWIALLQPAAALLGNTRLVSARRGLAGVLIVGMLGVALFNSVKYAKRIATSAAARDAVLSQRLEGYGMWHYLRDHPAGKIYQMGMEGSIYYAPRPVWGEVFGPWRYRDFATLAPATLHAKLSAQGFDTLVVNTGLMPDVTTRPEFEKWFTPVHAEQSVHLYRLAP